MFSMFQKLIRLNKKNIKILYDTRIFMLSIHKFFFNQCVYKNHIIISRSNLLDYYNNYNYSPKKLQYHLFKYCHNSIAKKYYHENSSIKKYCCHMKACEGTAITAET